MICSAVSGSMNLSEHSCLCIAPGIIQDYGEMRYNLSTVPCSSCGGWYSIPINAGMQINCNDLNAIFVTEQSLELHPRAKLISPTHKMCSSILAPKSAKRIQRNVCLAMPARTRQEGKKQNAQASQKKKFATVAVLCRSTLTFMFLQSWMTHGSMTGLMTGVVFS